MRKILSVALALALIFTSAACGVINSEGSTPDTASPDEVQEENSQNSMENIAKEEPAEPTVPALPTEGMITMDITVGNTTFTAKMDDNETTEALIAQLPMTVNMSELNGLEKFYDLPSDLPAESTERPASIHAGEIMIWSSNTLVLFYNTFSNSNEYVKVGYIEDISGLASALGTGSVQVTFSVSDR
ncbi:cyclophilin-like fold protein [Paenibacillus harenae]|uniref:cyclophilin-like fold protein n=1 Tax=Paenibacillus harenae TaxID=306543 RepID=UPI00068701E2|nr:cyclophilin-like fold protein [Paenibacillus harenae]